MFDSPDCEARNCTNEASHLVEECDAVFCTEHFYELTMLREQGYVVEVAVSVLCD